MTTMEAKPDRDRTVVGRFSAEGFVDAPLEEIDPTATYTIEAEINGRWYRWTGVGSEIVGDRAHFALQNGAPIPRPADLAEGEGFEPSRPPV